MCDVPVKELTRHFVERWHQRLGAVPSIESVNLMISRGQCLKRGRTYYRKRRGSFVPVRTLTQYWSDRHGVIIWVDDSEGRAVTVIVPREPRPGMGKAKKGGKRNGGHY